MTMNRTNELGNVIITKEAVASLTAMSIAGCCGVVGMANKNYIRDHFVQLLKKQNYSKGVFVRKKESGFELDVYIVIAYGANVSEVTKEVQRKVKYDIENAFDIVLAAVNVFVQGVRTLN